MQAARRLIHTEIVYVKRLYIGQALAVYILLVYAEHVSENAPVLLRNENRRHIIGDYSLQFFIDIFFRAGLKKIRPYIAVYLMHLIEKLIYIRYIPLLRSSYLDLFHIALSPSVL